MEFQKVSITFLTVRQSGNASKCEGVNGSKTKVEGVLHTVCPVYFGKVFLTMGSMPNVNNWLFYQLVGLTQGSSDI